MYKQFLKKRKGKASFASYEPQRLAHCTMGHFIKYRHSENTHQKTIDNLSHYVLLLSITGTHTSTVGTEQFYNSSSLCNLMWPFINVELVQ